MDLLQDLIDEYPDFPKKGIIFKDILPILTKPTIFKNLINSMSEWDVLKKCDAIIAIDARGFIFGSAVALEMKKPLVLARKPGKLPGELLEKTYQLEYGTNSLCIQKKLIKPYETFVIIDDLLATGGTVNCVRQIIHNEKKSVIGLSVLIELQSLLGREKFNFPVSSILKC